ncbi:DsbA family oxidoreductase [Cobetia sp. QF-1]|uniref:DsbA family oxidoreductase n=1 Tax=Cobetia sp. QF-1 TaxID=1969833 RepID=UPI000B540DBE|nr:DsbA family oxidoreductase [Cobetia sp. QF-1]
MSQLDIQVAYDVVCPWCWIGKRHLDEAIAQLDFKDEVRVSYLPFQLNPWVPREGMARADYRAQKFGSVERGEELDAQVAQSGAQSGVTFRHSLMQRTPNSTDAQRIVWRQQSAGLPERPLLEALFVAYFHDGKDVGDKQVLAEIASQYDDSVSVEQVLAFLQSSEGEQDVAAQQEALREAGIQSVPSTIVGKFYVPGAQPAEVLVQMLTEARQQQAE